MSQAFTFLVIRFRSTSTPPPTSLRRIQSAVINPYPPPPSVQLRTFSTYITGVEKDQFAHSVIYLRSITPAASNDAAARHADLRIPFSHDDFLGKCANILTEETNVNIWGGGGELHCACGVIQELRDGPPLESLDACIRQRGAPNPDETA